MSFLVLSALCSWQVDVDENAADKQPIFVRPRDTAIKFTCFN
jgi:hypothetical protein